MIVPGSPEMKSQLEAAFDLEPSAAMFKETSKQYERDGSRHPRSRMDETRPIRARHQRAEEGKRRGHPWRITT